MVNPYCDEDHPVIARLTKKLADLTIKYEAEIEENKKLKALTTLKLNLTERVVDLEKENANLKAENELIRETCHPQDVARIRGENAKLKANETCWARAVMLDQKFPSFLAQEVAELEKENANLKAEIYKLKGLNTMEGRWKSRDLGLSIHPSWKKEQS